MLWTYLLLKTRTVLQEEHEINQNQARRRISSPPTGPQFYRMATPSPIAPRALARPILFSRWKTARQSRRLMDLHFSGNLKSTDQPERAAPAIPLCWQSLPAWPGTLASSCQNRIQPAIASRSAMGGWLWSSTTSSHCGSVSALLSRASFQKAERYAAGLFVRVSA